MSQEPDEVRASSRRPRFAIWGAVLVAIVWLFVGALGGAAQGKLAGVQSNDNSTFLPKNAESTLVSNAVATFTESDSLPYLVVAERNDGGDLTPEDLQAVAEFAQGVPDLALPELGEGAVLGERGPEEDLLERPRDTHPDAGAARQVRVRCGHAPVVAAARRFLGAREGGADHDRIRAGGERLVICRVYGKHTDCKSS